MTIKRPMRERVAEWMDVMLVRNNCSSDQLELLRIQDNCTTTKSFNKIQAPLCTIRTHRLSYHSCTDISPRDLLAHSDLSIDKPNTWRIALCVGNKKLPVALSLFELPFERLAKPFPYE
jgi:hypothetical protein